jgi:hypothetical protein
VDQSNYLLLLIFIIIINVNLYIYIVVLIHVKVDLLLVILKHVQLEVGHQLVVVQFQHQLVQQHLLELVMYQLEQILQQEHRLLYLVQVDILKTQILQ